MSQIRIKKHSKMHYYRGDAPTAKQRRIWERNRKLRERIELMRKRQAGMSPELEREIELRKIHKRVEEAEAEEAAKPSFMEQVRAFLRKSKGDPDPE